MNNTTLYIPIPRAILDEKRSLLASHGFTLPGDSGSGSFRGIEFRYEYNGTHLILDIKKSILVPTSLIKSQIATWLGVMPQEKSQ